MRKTPSKAEIERVAKWMLDAGNDASPEGHKLQEWYKIEEYQRKRLRSVAAKILANEHLSIIARGNR